MPAQQESPLLQNAYDVFLLDREAQRFTQSTLEFYRGRLGPFIREVGAETPDDITPDKIRQFLAGMSHLSAYSQLGAYRAISTFCNFCEREGWLQTNPIRNVTKPRVEKRLPEIYTADQIKVILKACKKRRDKTMVLFMLDTGIRAAEMAQLTGGDIDTKTGRVRIFGKGRKERTVMLGPTARRELARYYAERGVPAKDDPVWLAHHGGGLSQSGIMQTMQGIAERVGFRVTCHKFRRTFATVSLRNGVDIFTVQAAMGHEGIETLQHYVRPREMRHGVVESMT